MPKFLSRFYIFLAAIFLLATPALSQTYPARGETPITDDAELLDAVPEAELAVKLTALEQETGVDIAILTLISTGYYTAGDDLDVYARAVMEEWEMNEKGILFMVFRDDRELRIELGTNYGADETAETAKIIEDTILPAFGDDDWQRGLTNGVDALITRVAGGAQTAATTPAAAASTPSEPSDEDGGSGLLWLAGLIGIPAALIALMVRRSKAKLAQTPCENCGKTGLSRSSHTLKEATVTSEGEGEVRLTCPSCNHIAATPFVISKKKPADNDEKAGGGGGGASGTF
ncbi:MAG: TPM domain-containing protein [Rhodobacteraceae bacterium]|nr:TPM domain-containing protein [Paracoccaceae bacterium]